MEPVILSGYLERYRQSAMADAHRRNAEFQASGVERTERSANRTGAHGAPSRLDAAEAVERRWGFALGSASECCQQYKSRGAAKESVQAPPLSPVEWLHLSRLANMPADCAGCGIIAGCAAMALGANNFVMREKTAEQSCDLTHDGRHAFLTVQVDRKKRNHQLDRTACTALHSVCGRTAWFTRWKDLSQQLTGHKSMIPDHNGKSGDPRGATQWIDQRMSWKRFSVMLRSLFLCDAIYSDDLSYPPPNLGKLRLESITPQSLKHTIPAVGPLVQTT